jgi:hypothetical protein
VHKLPAILGVGLFPLVEIHWNSSMRPNFNLKAG